MCDYQKEQERLQKLFEDISTASEESADDEESDEYDFIEERSEDSNSEQDLDEAEANGSTLENQPVFIGRDGLTKWKKHSAPNKHIKTRSENLVKILPGVPRNLKHLKSPIEIWSKFFTDDIINQIVIHTNEKIKAESGKFARERDCKPTDIPEVKALLGLFYLAGVRKANRLNTEDLWKTDGTGIEAFRLTMSITRFRFLLRYLRFDDQDTREQRRRLDKLAPIREIFTTFIENCKNNYIHSEYVTVDEKLEGFRGRCGFRQYIPTKPNKYGIKIFALCDAKMFYTSNMEVYVGMQPDGPYKQNNSGKCIVERLCEHIYNTNRNVTTDNWFTSMELATSLQSHGLTLLGTIRKNKKQLPPQFIQGNRPVGSSMFAFRNDCTLVSYIPKRGKNVLLISGIHDDDAINRLSGKPEIIEWYNSTKCGVDVVDQYCAQYNVARNTRRWPVVVFYSMMNVAGINSLIIYSGNNPDIQIKRRNFLLQLSQALVYDHQKIRASSSNLPKSLKLRLWELLGIEESVPKQQGSNKRGRCSICDSKKNRPTKYFCIFCKTYLCLEHASIICELCYQKKCCES